MKATSFIASDEINILCLLGAIDDDKLLNYVKSHGGVPYNWEEKAGLDYDATWEEQDKIRRSSLYSFYKKMASESVFNYQVKEGRISEIRLGVLTGKYSEEELYRELNWVPEQLKWEEWAKSVDQPLTYDELVRDHGYKKQCGKTKRSVTVTTDKPGYECTIWYYRPDKHTPALAQRIILRIKGGKRTELPTNTLFNYNTLNSEVYVNGCNSGDCWNGRGVYYDTSTLILRKGQFKNGQLNGDGEIHFIGYSTQQQFTFETALVGKYVGHFINDVACGEGKLYFSDGRMWDGQVLDWLPHGKGEMYKKGYLTTGITPFAPEYYVRGVYSGRKAPLGITFNECEERALYGAERFDSEEYASVMQAISDRNRQIDLVIQEYIKLHMKQFMALEKAGIEPSLDVLRDYAHELRVLTDKMVIHPLDEYNAKLINMALKANCTKDVNAITERITAWLTGAQNEIDNIRARTGVMAVRIENLSEVQIASNYLTEVPKALIENEVESYMLMWKRVLTEYNKLSDVQCK